MRKSYNKTKGISKKNEYHVYFMLRGFDYDPSEITRRINIVPTGTWIAGDTKRFPKGGEIAITQNTWELKSKLPLNIAPEEQLMHLLQILNPIKDRLIQLTNEARAIFFCAAYYYEVNPGVYIEREILAEMAEYNADFHLDMYCLRMV